MTTATSRPVFGAQPGSIDTPAWVHHAIFYQIFPDRFAKSDRLEKPSGIEPWDTDPTVYGYKGGDLLGIVERVDYLTDLGITAIYLNPIFQSAANHRYHTHDYFKVDPLLGSDAAFDELLQACHERDIRVVIDGVFNHASRGFFYFNDVLENGDASPWHDWFHIEDDPPINAYDHNQPPGYKAWWGLHALPKLNTDHPQMREYLMQVGEYWVRKGIDGWRLDVPEEIETPGFWEEFRERVRAINPEAWIVGEIWGNARAFLQGDRFDGVMNYLFTSAALAFTGRHRIDRQLQEGRAYTPWPGIDGTTYARQIKDLLGLYDWNVQLAQMNLLGSHDTARAVTLAGGDVRTMELAALLMFTFPGAPTIYYGDEIGLDGGLPDRWARKSFPWDHEERWNRNLLDTFKRLIALRRAHEVLRTGAYLALRASPGSYAFQRGLVDSKAIVALNTSDTPDRLTIEDMPAGGPALVIGETPSVEGDAVRIPARSGAVWLAQPEAGQ
ncbi:MAG: glycoside hydrolase family 13 protein [Chloroflexota bacterium]|nr:glycoside hydrolase family 13 protein [Chloroflexota bacterium]